MSGIRSAWWVAGALLLAGCVSTPSTVAVRQYTLGPANVTIAPAHAPTAATRGVLRMARIETPDWLAGTAMHYRLAYQRDHQLAAYALSAWAAPPASLLAPLLQRAVRADGAWQAVIGPGDTAAAAATVHVRLNAFGQVFAAATDSAGVVDADATLVDDRTHRVVAQHHFHVEVPAAAADAPAGVQALTQASQKLATQLAAWLRTAPR
ncbi:MAG TPA: ABC-type transport auxiliary lipoprotein family protein [Rhodanobacteraceae bacterium]